MLLTSPVAISFKIVCGSRWEARSARRPFLTHPPLLLICEQSAGGMPVRKSKAQKRADAFRMEVPREDDKVFHRIMSEWWDSAAEAWGSRWRPPVQEMGILVTSLQDLPRREKQDGALYFMRNTDGRVMQANLYTKGNAGDRHEVTIAMLEERMHACPLLAAGSIMAPLKQQGGHVSEFNVFCRTVLNFSLVVGFSIHGDKLHAKDRTSNIGHGWLREMPLGFRRDFM